MKASYVVFGLVSLLLLTAFSRDETFNPDGRIYSVKIKELNSSGKVDKWTDEVLFESGKIGSGFSVKNGFDYGTYTLTPVDGGAVYNFVATGMNPIGETLKWEGTLKSANIKGKAERSDTGTIYFFQGNLK